MPLMLTKKEHKKLRTQRRVEKEKEKQELIRQVRRVCPGPVPVPFSSSLHAVFAPCPHCTLQG